MEFQGLMEESIDNQAAPDGIRQRKRAKRIRDEEGRTGEWTGPIKGGKEAQGEGVEVVKKEMERHRMIIAGKMFKEVRRC